MTNQEYWNKLKEEREAAFQNLLKLDNKITVRGFADIFNVPNYQQAYDDYHRKVYAYDLFYRYWLKNQPLDPSGKYTNFADPNFDEDDLRDGHFGR